MKEPQPTLAPGHLPGMSNPRPASASRGIGGACAANALAFVSVAALVYVFTHPRCWTAAGADQVPYLLAGIWLLAMILAVAGLLAGSVGLFRCRGKRLSAWIGLFLCLMALIGGIAYPVMFVFREVADELSKPGSHLIGK